MNWLNNKVLKWVGIVSLTGLFMLGSVPGYANTSTENPSECKVSYIDVQKKVQDGNGRGALFTNPSDIKTLDERLKAFTNNVVGLEEGVDTVLIVLFSDAHFLVEVKNGCVISLAPMPAAITYFLLNGAQPKQ